MTQQDQPELSLQVAGPRAWHSIEHAYQEADRIAEEAVRNIPCRTCSGEEGLELVRGIHDVKNIELGKPVFDPQGFQRFKSRVERAADMVGLDPPENLKTQLVRKTDNTDILILGGILGLIGLVSLLATRKAST